MRVRWLLPLAVLALPATAGAQMTPPEQAPQALFGGLIVNDPNTTADIRAQLSAGAAYVAARPRFADLTGDGKTDAVVEVRVPGAAGTVGVYAFSTDGAAEGQLRAVLRSQRLYRATVSVAPGTLLVTVPEYAEGNEVCCPAARSERRYGWDAGGKRLRRR
jgi:hypothetical protein